MNTRLLGTAIINSGSLVDYAIHLYKQPWSPSKATLIVRSLEPCVRRYCIKTVVLSIPHAYHQTKASNYLCSRICKYFKEKGITVSTQPVAALYSLCPQAEKKTKKRRVMEAIATMFPELSYVLYKEQRNKNKYYMKLFEAVGIAMLQGKQ